MITDNEFLRFVHMGSPLWINKGFKDLDFQSMHINKVEINMDKYSRDCSYEEMSKGIGGQSIEQEYWDEPMCNAYEESRKDWNENGYDQSGMKGSK